MLVALLASLSVPAPPAPPGYSRAEIVSFKAEQISCADGPVATGGLVRPRTTVWTRYGSVSDAAPPPTYQFDFAIDGQGRARTIRRDATPPPAYYFDASDLAPSLAASHFPAGAPHDRCSIRYKASFDPIETAAISDLYELASRPEPAGNAPSLYERVRPAGSTCPREPGQYRRLNLPAFERMRPISGDPAWVFFAFDVDARGKPADVRVLGTSGDAELDAAGRHALLANRYVPGPGYRGCTYHFHLSDVTEHPAPDLPADAPGGLADQPGCMIDPKSISGLLNGSAYPTPFARRRIEGVAIVGYDTAPWGAVGNVKVLLSEPDEMFGAVARDAFMNAHVAEGATGQRGCVQRVKFKLPPAYSARRSLPVIARHPD
ncbi:energy transducer TonB [Sphingomonas sp. GC_Shp_3]|uniref:energy transducer TonB n=1 Tax=Sphingomonas sp. GC_Shp_3 TaxID=2937383 RepID=UPI00226AAF96|nr:energy transducer TonB [Sphingomonas sp. GC_Shp_3]